MLHGLGGKGFRSISVYNNSTSDIRCPALNRIALSESDLCRLTGSLRMINFLLNVWVLTVLWWEGNGWVGGYLLIMVDSQWKYLCIKHRLIYFVILEAYWGSHSIIKYHCHILFTSDQCWYIQPIKLLNVQGGSYTH